MLDSWPLTESRCSAGNPSLTRAPPRSPGDKVMMLKGLINDFDMTTTTETLIETHLVIV